MLLNRLDYLKDSCAKRATRKLFDCLMPYRDDYKTSPAVARTIYEVKSLLKQRLNQLKRD